MALMAVGGTALPGSASTQFLSIEPRACVTVDQVSGPNADIELICAATATTNTNRTGVSVGVMTINIEWPTASGFPCPANVSSFNNNYQDAFGSVNVSIAGTGWTQSGSGALGPQCSLTGESGGTVNGTGAYSGMTTFTTDEFIGLAGPTLLPVQLNQNPTPQILLTVTN